MAGGGILSKIFTKLLKIPDQIGAGNKGRKEAAKRGTFDARSGSGKAVAKSEEKIDEKLKTR